MGGMVSAVGEYTPDEFWRLLDSYEEVIEALKPFAVCVEQIASSESDEEWAKFRLLVGDYRRAAKALEPRS